MWEGTPCLENTWSKNNFASSSKVIVSYMGMKMHCFERRSTTTSTEVKPEEEGSCSIKSMDMEFQGRSGMGSCFNKPKGLCRGTLAQAHDVQEDMYFLTKVQI